MSRKEIIIQKYLILSKELEEFVDKSIFPIIDENFNIVDVLALIHFYFPKDKEEEYINTINYLIATNDIKIKNENLSAVHSLIISFLNFLNNI